MPWSKVKNIILAILVVLNLLLLIPMLGRQAATRRQERSAREDALELLSRSGIRVSPSILPEDPALVPLVCERDTAAEPALAAELLGGEQSVTDGGYTGTRGSVWFSSSGGFAAEFPPGAYPLGDSDPGEHALQVLGALGFTGEVLAVVPDGEGITVTVRQIRQGIPLFSCEAVARYENGDLLSLRGTRLPGEPIPVSYEEGMNVTTALVRFRGGIAEGGFVCGEITALTAGYEMSAVPASGIFRLESVWRIDTDAGSYRLTGDGTLIPLED